MLNCSELRSELNIGRRNISHYGTRALLQHIRKSEGKGSVEKWGGAEKWKDKEGPRTAGCRESIEREKKG